MTKRLTGLFAVLSLAVFLGAGCGSTDNSQTDSGAESGSPIAEESNEDNIVSMDETGTVGTLEYTISNIELLDTEIPAEYSTFGGSFAEPLPADDGRSWLRVETMVKNTGNEKVSLLGSDFIVENDSGQRIESSTEASIYIPEDNNAILQSELQPGVEKEYVMYFDIPEESENLIFLAPGEFDPFTADDIVVRFALDVDTK